MHKIIKSDIYSGLNHIKDNSIDVAVTSPPYWGQRDYGFDGQIGNEKDYKEYIGKLETIFGLLKKKLNKKGVFFLNIGDKYLSKYGNTPLAMIPYKLAYFMTKDNWILNDIIIWYKPNHMPSSVKNRFTNSYEPVFVFSKHKNNYYTEFKKKNKESSNVLKINLQPTPYNHIAVYPEKLVSSLLESVNVPNNGLVLDPFAGSGTTLKAVQSMNENHHKNYSSIMIDSSKDYIDIIKRRCSLSDDSVFCYDYIKYNYKSIHEDDEIIYRLFNNISTLYNIRRGGLIKILNYKEEYLNFLSLIKTKKFEQSIDKDAICFIGLKDFNIELIYKTSLLNNSSWVIRNMVVVEKNKRWYPVFMIVHDNKKVKYNFNYQKLKLKHKNGLIENWHHVDFKGFKVTNNIDKKRMKGVIVDVIDKHKSGFPKYVIVKWGRDNYTQEFVIDSQRKVNENLIIKESKIGFGLRIREKKNLTNLNNFMKEFRHDRLLQTKNNKSNYHGKFKHEKRKNWGASPGARASVDEEYFSMQRLYNVDQRIVSDYLNYKRMFKRLSKSQLTSLFPRNYKHTVGHWLRKDFGGSIPIPVDWQKLNNILNLDNYFTNYVCKTALKLQTVKQSEFKMPEDFIKQEDSIIFDNLVD